MSVLQVEWLTVKSLFVDWTETFSHSTSFRRLFFVPLQCSLLHFLSCSVWYRFIAESWSHCWLPLPCLFWAWWLCFGYPIADSNDTKTNCKTSGASFLPKKTNSKNFGGNCINRQHPPLPRIQLLFPQSQFDQRYRQN